jgi:hypothetical protein
MRVATHIWNKPPRVNRYLSDWKIFWTKVTAENEIQIFRESYCTQDNWTSVWCCAVSTPLNIFDLLVLQKFGESFHCLMKIPAIRNTLHSSPNAEGELSELLLCVHFLTYEVCRLCSPSTWTHPRSMPQFGSVRPATTVSQSTYYGNLLCQEGRGGRDSGPVAWIIS